MYIHRDRQNMCLFVYRICGIYRDVHTTTNNFMHSSTNAQVYKKTLYLPPFQRTSCICCSYCMETHAQTLHTETAEGRENVWVFSVYYTCTLYTVQTENGTHCTTTACIRAVCVIQCVSMQCNHAPHLQLA